MPVPLGFVAGTLVTTPAGPRPIEALAPGDTVLGWVEGRLLPARVAAVHADAADVLVAIETEAGTVRGCTPGTSLLDVFEDAFRAAASLSTTSELLRLDGEGTRPAAVVEVLERAAAGDTVHHLGLDRPVGAFFADGMLALGRDLG